jgi:hypothetical protein
MGLHCFFAATRSLLLVLFAMVFGLTGSGCVEQGSAQ